MTREGNLRCHLEVNLRRHETGGPSSLVCLDVLAWQGDRVVLDGMKREGFSNVMTHEGYLECHDTGKAIISHNTGEPS